MGMRILKISRFSPVPYREPKGFGGAAIEEPMIILSKGGMTIDVVAPVPYAPFPLSRMSYRWGQYSQVPAIESMEGIEVYHPRYLSIPGSYLFSIAGRSIQFTCSSVVRRLQWQGKYDLVHAHFGYPDGYLGMKVARRLGIPLIVTIQATDVDITAAMNANCRAMLGQICAYAHSVISPTRSLAERLRRIYDIESTVVHYGIDPRRVCMERRTGKGEYRGRYLLLSVSQLIASKGVDITIQAVSSLASSGYPITCVVVGDGPERSRLQQLAIELGVGSHIRFMGALSHSETMEYMRLCDIFCLPSWQETFGLVYVEAMAHGKPIVCCRGQGIADVVAEHECGVIAEVKDVRSIVSAIESLLNNQYMREEMGTRGEQAALSYLTHKACARATAEIYCAARNRG